MLEDSRPVVQLTTSIKDIQYQEMLMVQDICGNCYSYL